MEDKITELAPPVILAPIDQEKLDADKLLLTGSGVPGAAIFAKSDFLRPNPDLDPWVSITEVRQDGSWSYLATDYNSEHPRNLFFSVRQTQHWPPETSLPSVTVNFTKRLGPPLMTSPIQGGELNPSSQNFEGTGYSLADFIDIEFKTVPPLPPETYNTSTTVDRSSRSWKATPAWPLAAGEYLLKCRQGNKDHLSRWSDEISVRVV